ncbi:MULTISPECIES: hypothetical protein [Enterococcus]|uniref:hypothetical protein n=1 Tax=Enterococcus TaxID=1350 RepID=UPI001CF38891|nr:hypothetical protein [Enterococcus faecalis]MCA6711246.1 hypothetical protein [Enterococcus faecalis]MCA6730108.1 hypothetical protein [Enterococcus faecalis]MCU9795359.1 hypothetical protein [Enterococcus faecalis]
MKKKSLITLLLSISLISVLIIAFSLGRKTESSHPATTSSSVATTNSSYPSLNQLKARQGANIQVLGKTQIVTVIFQDKNIALLAPESGEKIQLPITVTNTKQNTFKIPDLHGASDTLKIGDTFGLAKINKQYFAYSLE